MSRIQKLIARWSGALVLSFCSFSYSNAQDTTNNILTNTWSGTINYTGTGGGFSGGNTPGYNSSTNTIHFGYTQSTVAQTIAINNALQGSGVKVGGANYGFSYYNQGEASGTLSSIFSITSNTGATLHSYSTNHGTTTNGWTPFSNNVTFGPYGLPELGNASLSFTGRDSRFWAGYYGPMVKDPYVNLTYTAATVTNPTFQDDTYVSVPLQFGFPFYGRTFTNSWMHSNGVVSFLDPAVPVPGAGYNPGQWAYCCGDQPTTTKPEFSYIIAPLWTDLYPTTASTFRTEGTTTYQKYFWNNIGEISNQNNLNTFSLEIRPTGFIGATYDKINLQNQNTWVGTVGDPTIGQINERFYGIPGLNSTSIPNWTLVNTPDACASNPLSSTTCPGYTEAMCSANPLYSTTCSGYQQAYFTQQCSITALYDPQCPGYAAAYLTYQCSINPLYSTTCDGYEKAYFDQQCSLDALYNNKCPGYAEAYFTQQCNLNGLYDRLCPNYSTAYATKMVLEQQGTASIVATAGTVAANAPTTTVSNDGTVSTTPSATGSAVVDKAVSSPTTTTNTAAAPAAPVQLVAPPPPPQQMAGPQQERKPEGKPEGGQQQAGGPQQQQQQQGGGDKPKTARQELAERRQEAAKKEAVEKGKSLANEMGKVADMESQKQVQNVVLQAMAFVPGFDAYGKALIPDARGYQPFTVYNNQRNVDNARLGRSLFGATDRLHNEMVDSQYQLGK